MTRSHTLQVLLANAVQHDSSVDKSARSLRIFPQRLLIWRDCWEAKSGQAQNLTFSMDILPSWTEHLYSSRDKERFVANSLVDVDGLMLGIDHSQLTSLYSGEGVWIPIPSVCGVALQGESFLGFCQFLYELQQVLPTVNTDIIEFHGSYSRSLTHYQREIVTHMVMSFGVRGVYFVEGNSSNIVYEQAIFMDVTKVSNIVTNVPTSSDDEVPLKGTGAALRHGDIVMAGLIENKRSVPNLYGFIGAALLAKSAVELGLSIRCWVKRFFIEDIHHIVPLLRDLGLYRFLDDLGFSLENSELVVPSVSKVLSETDLRVFAISSVEELLLPSAIELVSMSPIWVVAYAIKGSLRVCWNSDPLGYGFDGIPVYLKELWPTDEIIHAYLMKI